jgi:hypothetical protein
MSIQDNVNFIKKELSGDEKVLESAFKLESLYKKYKIPLFVVLSVLIGLFVTKTIQDRMKEMKLEDANRAFISLNLNPKDVHALASLKANNPALYELYRYSVSLDKKDKDTLKTLSKSKNSTIADISNYSLNILEHKPTQSELYNDMAIYINAYSDIKNKKLKEAKDKLSLIDENSPLAVISKFLKHSTILK